MKRLPKRVASSALGASMLKTIDVQEDVISNLYETGGFTETFGLSENEPAIFKSIGGSALGFANKDKVSLVKERKPFGVRGRNAEQRVAFEFLMNQDIPIVSLGGYAGTGKSLLAMAAGLEQTLEEGIYERVIVFRPLFAVGGQDLGFLPGDFDEKMEPWKAAVYDVLESACREEVVDYIISEDMLEVLPITHVRGRTLHNTFVIVDEAQNLDFSTLLTILTRLGENSKIVLTYDVSQRDNPEVDKDSGVIFVVSRLMGNPMFGHVSLTKIERSPVVQFVYDVFSDYI